MRSGGPPRTRREGECRDACRRLARVRARVSPFSRAHAHARASSPWDSSPYFAFSLFLGWCFLLRTWYVVALLRILYRRPTATLRIAHYYSEWGPPTANRCDLSPRSERFTRCTMNLFCEVAARARLSPVQQTRKSAKTKGVLVLVNSQSTRRGPSRLLSPSRGPFGPLDLPLGLLSRPCRRPCLPIPTTPRRRRKKPQTTPKRQSP